ncbi:NAD(P)H-hydrate dehydratase [Paracoccus siganidrum]|uniref:Bifunctional NAD(P)H-hydrate repair enzyme n=1 Tax=Paracoccus siganidrum TaxID=1276757 RepID=A0A419A9K9_9RHOB|nr:NAD(P)H-hydrate dehydratase [Paracoccus siganidrum]RJL19122.1 NAD(P)H-hydrate dehydratase [Paracoccus siganidrum]RMC40618.1 bifunctional ADP-dependent NAD(P)H-hydrate dehydratase/NAD(P)H-hydrate epimerase [Paracoccus siganidrum]
MPIGTEILTTAQMRATESAAMASGRVSGAALMERAGRAVAGQIRLRWPRPGRVTVLCGPGNNGGDGYVIARRLHQAGWRVRVLGLDNAPGPDAEAMRRQWLAIGPILPLTEQALRDGPDSDVHVDAIFGTGLTRPPEGEIATILRHLGDSRFRDGLVAVDCPSGLCMDSGAMLGWPRGTAEHAPAARLTVAFDSPKPGHLLEQGPILCGQLVIADIGLREWREGQGAGIRLGCLWPAFDIADGRCQPVPAVVRAGLDKGRTRHGHKFSHGHALVIAGGPGRGGAARLSARAALRAGAGLVTLCPPDAAMAEHAQPPDALMRRPMDGAEDLTALLTDRRISGLCLGPGCGIDRAAVLLPALLASRRPCVLDADALTALATHPALAGALHEACVLTPHAGEFGRLFPDIAERLQSGSDDPAAMRGPAFSRLDAAREAAARAGAIVLLKGPDTVIAAPDGRAMIHSAFDLPWLATAGAGDVLAGLVAGLLARGLPALRATGLATWLHGQAARRLGPGLTADDLPEALPAVLRQSGL